MNNFKEWLSDYLRYFILGGVVILVLIVAFFVIRFGSDEPSDKQPKAPVTQETKENTPEPQPEESSEEVTTPMPTKVVTQTNTLEKNARPQVNAIIQKYYKALSDKDVAGINAVVDEFDQTEATKITNDQHLDGYSNVEVYTKDGLVEGEHFVLARYNYKFKDIDTLVPGLSQIYVRTREDGNLYITMQEHSPEVKAYIDKMMEEADVKNLIDDVRTEYDKVQEEDENLRNFIASLGIARSQAATAEDGSSITIKNNCNVRSLADTSGEVVAQLTAGTQVTKLGVEGEWIQISFEGEQTGYVRSDLFE